MKTTTRTIFLSRLAIPVAILCLLYANGASGQTVRQVFSDDGQLLKSEPAVKNDDKLPDPLVDEDMKLIALSPDRSIFLDADRKSVVFLGEVCLREGPLEFFVCSRNSKEHESVIATRAKPSLIHVGLLALGAEPGTPVQFAPKFAAPTGPRIDVKIRWLDKDGKRQEAKAEEWVQEVESKKPMSTHWVFTGSMFRKLEGGKDQYLADVTGEIFGVSNFPTVVLDLPIASTSDNNDLIFQAFTEKIPNEGTEVTVILSCYEKEIKK